MPRNNVSGLSADQEMEKLRRREERREQVLDRLWELAALSSEMTRGSITGQVKALQMIVAIEGLIPDGRASSAKRNSVPAPIYLQPGPATPASADVPRGPVPSESTFANRFTPSRAPEPYVLDQNGGSAHRR